MNVALANSKHVGRPTRYPENKQNNHSGNFVKLSKIDYTVSNKGIWFSEESRFLESKKIHGSDEHSRDINIGQKCCSYVGDSKQKKAEFFARKARTPSSFCKAPLEFHSKRQNTRVSHRRYNQVDFKDVLPGLEDLLPLSSHSTSYYSIGQRQD